jgi:hypothetical protein
MQELTIVEAYEKIIYDFYADGSYTLSRACLIWDFTKGLIVKHPELTEEIKTVYNILLLEHYPPLYLASCILW